MIGIARFKNITDNEPKPQELEWSVLVELLTTFAERKHKDGPLWSPTIYRPDTTRAKENVAAVTCLVLDFDNGVTYEEMAPKWEGLIYLAHSSYRHMLPEVKGAARWRAVFPLLKDAPGDEWPAIYPVISAAIGGTHIDTNCKDSSRIFYLPSYPPGWAEQAFVHVHEGECLDWTAYELPPAPAPVPVAPVQVTGNGHARYVEVAVERELQRLNAASFGQQDTQINKSSFALGTLVGAGVLGQREAEEALIATALQLPSQPGREPWTREKIEKKVRRSVEAGIKKPRILPEPNKTPLIRGRSARAYITGGNPAAVEEDEPEEDASIDEDERTVNEGIYAVLNGRTVLAVQKSRGKETGSDENTSRHFVADFAACIVGEVRDETGVALYEVEGKTKDGRPFSIEIPATKWTDPKAVCSALKNVIGAGVSIFAGMEKHVGPSIDSFTDKSRLHLSRRFNRTGWTRDMKEFIIPGMEASDTIITLSKELAYRVKPPDTPASRLPPVVEDALRALLEGHRTQLTTIAFIHALLAPFAPLADWRDDKFALFIVGRTGSFKTSWTVVLMSIYGDFTETNLLKFGMGGTTNAMMSFTADAADMPLLIDNFKPGTGNGQKDAQSLIHGVLEGGEKKRLNRDGTRREGKDIHCWPVFTGEDTAEDAASIVRTLIVPANWDGSDPVGLSRAQSIQHLLPAIGGAWLAWLLTDEAKIVATYVRSIFPERRVKWATFLRNFSKDMVNINRVASSLALCECGWEAASACPAFKPVLDSYKGEFMEGLKEVAKGMAIYSAQSHEANRYLAALRSLLTTNRAYLAHVARDFDKEDRRVPLGWEDDKALYLQPEAAFAEVSKYLRDMGGLNGLGMNTIHKQLEQLGHLAKKGQGHFTTPKRVGIDSKPVRLLWIKRDSVFGCEDEEE